MTFAKAIFKVAIVLAIVTNTGVYPVFFAFAVFESARPFSDVLVASCLERAVSVLKVILPLAEVYVPVVELLLAESVPLIELPLASILETVLSFVLAFAVTHSVQPFPLIS